MIEVDPAEEGLRKLYALGGHTPEQWKILEDAIAKLDRKRKLPDLPEGWRWHCEMGDVWLPWTATDGDTRVWQKPGESPWPSTSISAPERDLAQEFDVVSEIVNQANAPFKDEEGWDSLRDLRDEAERKIEAFRDDAMVQLKRQTISLWENS